MQSKQCLAFGKWSIISKFKVRWTSQFVPFLKKAIDLDVFRPSVVLGSRYCSYFHVLECGHAVAMGV